MEPDVKEFDCIDCGRHIVAICPSREAPVCTTCIMVPGWFNDPELRDLFLRTRDDPSFPQFLHEIVTKTQWMELNLNPLSAMKLAGLMHLVLKHPTLPKAHVEFAHQVLRVAREYFADSPGVLAVIEAGDLSVDAERAARSS